MKYLKLALLILLCLLLAAAVAIVPVYFRGDTLASSETQSVIEKPQNLITVNGVKLHKSSKIINLSNCEIADLELFIEELSALPNLKEISLYNTNLTLEQRNQLVDAMPEIDFNWIVDFGNLEIDSREGEYVSVAGENLAELEDFDLGARLNLLTRLKKIDMSNCGFSNSQMGAFVEEFPDIKIVWEIKLSRYWTVRTDAVSFSTFQGLEIEHRLKNYEAQDLKYCTDLVALDLGHNDVTDLSFLKYMPNLKILILADAKLGVKDDKWTYIEDLSMLKYCPKLEYLEFFVGGVTDLSFLEHLPNLKDLNLSHNPVSDITYLKNLPNIERLFIINTNISDQDYLELVSLYPNAQVERYGDSSIDKGWRKHPRYYAMYYTFESGKLHPEYQ